MPRLARPRPSMNGMSGCRPISRLLASMATDRSVPMYAARTNAMPIEMSSKPSGVGPSQGDPLRDVEPALDERAVAHPGPRR